jgi:anti-sigma regulatory factor (Ser/Thr protein kinase)
MAYVNLQEAYRNYITLRYSGTPNKIRVSEDVFLPCITIGLIKRAEELGKVKVEADPSSSYTTVAERGDSVKNNLIYQSLPKDPTDKNNMTSKMQKKLEIEEQAIRQCISELIDNIQEHSKTDHSCMIAQRRPNENNMDIFIADNGVTIPHTYEENSITMESDCEAIQKALEGWSTKETEGRGRGLGTTWRIIRELEGEAILYSRKAGIFTTNAGTTLYSVDNRIQFDGTMVAFRVPCDASMSNDKFYQIVDETV